MPAISADTVALPRIPDPDPTAADRPVVSVTTAPSGLEREGFPPGEPNGTSWASPPWVRDRHLHDRRGAPP